MPRRNSIINWSEWLEIKEAGRDFKVLAQFLRNYDSRNLIMLTEHTPRVRIKQYQPIHEINLYVALETFERVCPQIFAQFRNAVLEGTRYQTSVEEQVERIEKGEGSEGENQ